MPPRPRPARSLDVLLVQVNERAPRRSTRSDGWLGDTAHSARTSDHNPDAHGVVRARDFTHDPGAGADVGRLADELVRSRDRRIRYLIWDGRIVAGAGGHQPWTWRPYTGPNPHRTHLHVSVWPAGQDDTTPWQLTPPTEEDDMFSDADRTMLKQTLEGLAHLDVDRTRRILDRVEDELDNPPPVVAGDVDLDALADRVLDRLAARLAQ